jgi:negative regulator of flagellin synthesis FlgM
MPPFEVGPARAVSAIEARMARHAGVKNGTAEAARTKNEPAVLARNVLDAGETPVDVERVQIIRKAVETGTYPVIPAKISDAMIAAGYILRSGE